MKPLGTPITETDWNAMDSRQREQTLTLLGIAPASRSVPLQKATSGTGAATSLRASSAGSASPSRRSASPFCKPVEPSPLRRQCSPTLPVSWRTENDG